MAGGRPAAGLADLVSCDVVLTSPGCEAQAQSSQGICTRRSEEFRPACPCGDGRGNACADSTLQRPLVNVLLGGSDLPRNANLVLTPKNGAHLFNLHSNFL